MQRNYIIKFTLLSALFLAACLLSLFYGGSESLSDKFLAENNFIFYEIRLPKTITAILAGCTLALSGLALQILFRNPLAGPYVLGISSGASLMVALVILAGNTFMFMTDSLAGKSLTVFAAITGSIAVTLLILAVSKKVSNNSVLLLIGLMFSQICGAAQTALEYFADPASLKTFVIWGMGSLGNTTTSDLYLYAPLSLAFCGSLFLFVKPLNALLLGQNYAQNVGVNFKKSRFCIILISSALTGITTAFCGPVAFIGIAVPVLSRMLFKTSNQLIHLFSCLLSGSTILLLSDALCHSSLSNVVLPINMITTFIGAPLVIYLMFKNKYW